MAVAMASNLPTYVVLEKGGETRDGRTKLMADSSCSTSRSRILDLNTFKTSRQILEFAWHFIFPKKTRLHPFFPLCIRIVVINVIWYKMHID